MKTLKYFLASLVAVMSFSCKETPAPEIPEDGELVLHPSTLFVVVGEENTIEFTATYGDADITNDPNLAVYYKPASGSQKVENNAYEVKAAGKYLFYAVYNDLISEEVEVSCITELPEAVADSAPEQFSGFRKRALGTLATGTWCPNCPYLIRAVHDYDEKYGENDDLVMVDVHSGGEDVMRSDASDKLADRLSIMSYPQLKFGMSGKTGNTIYNGNRTAEDIKAVVDAHLASDALTAISANSILDGNKLYVRADIKIGAEGTFKAGVWLLEDGIEAYQADALADYMNIHNDAIFGAYPMNFSMCESIGGVKTQDAESQHIFYCEFDLKKFPTLQNIENGEIVVFVYNDDNKIKSVDNIIKFPVGGSFAFDYE